MPTTPRDPEEEKHLKQFFADMAVVAKEAPIAAAAGRAALARVVRAVWQHRTSGQSESLIRILASLYNGSSALPVDIAYHTSGLDWTLKKDICAVILGKGLDGFPDTEIREEFRRAGGEAAVDWLHWHTTGGPARAALDRLVQFCLENKFASTARMLRSAMRSLHGSGGAVDLQALSRASDDITGDFLLVLDASIGSRHGIICDAHVAEAFERAGGSEWFFEDIEKPVSTAAS